MRDKAPFVCLGMLVVFLGVPPGASAEHAAKRPGPKAELGFQGTWWLTSGPPASRPLVLTLTASGTFVLEDSIDGGGHTFSGAAFSLTQGTWRRTGRRTARALGLRFVYDAEGKTRAVERIRLQLSFAKGFERLQGEYQIEEMGCGLGAPQVPFTVPVCPDPTVAPTEVLRGPASLSGVRVPIGAPGENAN